MTNWIDPKIWKLTKLICYKAIQFEERTKHRPGKLFLGQAQMDLIKEISNRQPPEQDAHSSIACVVEVNFGEFPEIIESSKKNMVEVAA